MIKLVQLHFFLVACEDIFKILRDLFEIRRIVSTNRRIKRNALLFIRKVHLLRYRFLLNGLCVYSLLFLALKSKFRFEDSFLNSYDFHLYFSLLSSSQLIALLTLFLCLVEVDHFDAF